MTKVRMLCVCGHDMDEHDSSTLDPFCNMGRCLHEKCECQYFDEAGKRVDEHMDEILRRNPGTAKVACICDWEPTRCQAHKSENDSSERKVPNVE